ncbi:GTP-binding protein [Histomonas meleagridis]|uniref:GTP-binding protein n=1 Tax=Histomonas meleagridis TaxID=135588 RepID=UPI00355AA2F3|nr:GTP-binding protein [Histomonas meleagridis]KAH0798476.1 GTP-binding protein [Histomonas meleagridis]
MNAGKSSLMNAITQQPTSIVDNTPGTTADTKIALMEIHKIGPCKLLDTAGVDETGALGKKKLQKTLSAVKESDVVLFTIDPDSFSVEPLKPVLELSQRRGKTSALIFNQINKDNKEFDKKKAKIEQEIYAVTKTKLPSLVINAQDSKQTNSKVIPFIANLKKQAPVIPLVPSKFIGKDKIIMMNVPLDIESPTGRLLRPQTMLLEYSLRHTSSVLVYNMDLKTARSDKSNSENNRFNDQIKKVTPSLLVTDSQAIDIIHKWTPLNIPITTFSVMMANIQSGGKLKTFIKGIEALGKLKPGDKVLICEACNHDRIGDDIGTVQLPTKLKKKFPFIKIDWAFGRSYENKKLSDYAVALHCGGCMISTQQMISRIQDLQETGVPVANYGLALSWLASPVAMERVLKPWNE